MTKLVNYFIIKNMLTYAFRHKNTKTFYDVRTAFLEEYCEPMRAIVPIKGRPSNLLSWETITYLFQFSPVYMYKGISEVLPHLPMDCDLKDLELVEYDQGIDKEGNLYLRLTGITKEIPNFSKKLWFSTMVSNILLFTLANSKEEAKNNFTSKADSLVKQTLLFEDDIPIFYEKFLNIKEEEINEPNLAQTQLELENVPKKRIQSFIVFDKVLNSGAYQIR